MRVFIYFFNSLLGFDKVYKKYLTLLTEKDFKINNYSSLLSSKEFQILENEYSTYLKKAEKESLNPLNIKGRLLLPFTVITWYAGRFYQAINECLRFCSNFDTCNKKCTEDECEKPRIEVLEQEISKFKTKNNFVAFRRISNIFLFKYYLKEKKLKKGVCFKDLGFVSTSLDSSYKKDIESNEKPLNRETMFIIKIPRGCNALYIAPISDRKEYELLLQRNTTMRIEDFKKIGNNYIVLTKVVL